MKISKRLQTIDSLINKHYDHIWDCCCDHGLLGMALLQRSVGEKIHFVDMVQVIMSGLTNNLQRFFSHNNRWQVHCVDVMSVRPVPNFAVQNHLLIIAGVGGEQMITMVKQLLHNFKGQRVEFLLCPVHHQFKLRQCLHALGLSLIDERLLQENRRFYEVIHVSNRPGKAISNVGCMMWQRSAALTPNYLKQTLAHYQRMSHDPAQNVANIISAYQQLQQELSEQGVTNNGLASLTYRL